MRTPSTRWATVALNLACGAAIALPFCAQGANLIDDTHGAGAGSFELGAYVDGGGNPNVAGAGYMGLLPGDGTTITGWTVAGPGDGIDWLSAPLYRAHSGLHSVDLQHLTKSSISTVIPTLAGTTYRLTFVAAAISGSDANGAVSAGTLVDQSFAAASSSSVSGQVFTPITALFTATSSATTITFRSVGPTLPLCAALVNCYGPIIDDVSVTAVPEPGSAWLLSIGLLTTAGLVTRSRRPAPSA